MEEATMQLSQLGRALYDEIAELTVIDAHEHLPAEAEYLSFGYCGPNMFAGGYIWHDLESAGLSPAFKATMRDGGYRPVEQWWPPMRPYWEWIKNTSYARALRITARDLYGLPALAASPTHAFAERVRPDTPPGLYRRILQERCRIRYSLTNVDQAGFPDDPGLRGLTMLNKGDPSRELLPASELLANLDRRAARELGSPAEAAAALQGLLRHDIAQGAVGLKMIVKDYGAPDPAAADRAWRRARLGLAGRDEAIALRDFLFDRALDVAAEAGVPVAVHTGYWGDFRDLDPKHLLAFARRRGDVHFDMFHLGMPMVRDAALIGKTLPNVTLNLTWCPVISQLQTQRTLDEMIDLVPLNKIIAFGGDYRASVQKVYGHLVMAREVVAAALAERVEAGDFDREYALYVAKLWFYENPCRVYRLPA
jgi:uncharacterized protein